MAEKKPRKPRIPKAQDLTAEAIAALKAANTPVRFSSYTKALMDLRQYELTVLEQWFK